MPPHAEAGRAGQAREPGGAARVGVGEGTRQGRFTQGTGRGVAQGREQARRVAALTAIGRGEKGIGVALDCGYASHRALTAMFRRHFGVPPSAFYR